MYNILYIRLKASERYEKKWHLHIGILNFLFFASDFNAILWVCISLCCSSPFDILLRVQRSSGKIATLSARCRLEGRCWLIEDLVVHY